MQTSYTVTITKKHCEETTYESCTDCALARAIREQIPSFPLHRVGGSYVKDEGYRYWHFDSGRNDVPNYDIYKTKWNKIMFKRLMKGEVKETSVTFTLEGVETRSVSIPESLKEQAEEMISVKETIKEPKKEMV